MYFKLAPYKNTLTTVIVKWINEFTAFIGILATETSELQQKAAILRPEFVGKIGSLT